jgi:hypothetical protein
MSAAGAEACLRHGEEIEPRDLAASAQIDTLGIDPDMPRVFAAVTTMAAGRAVEVQAARVA